jgi:hypothetical protein
MASRDLDIKIPQKAASKTEYNAEELKAAASAPQDGAEWCGS